MSVKYWNGNKWVIFPGTTGLPGKDAYIIAKENGYEGTREEYENILVNIPEAIKYIEELTNIVNNLPNTLIEDSLNSDNPLKALSARQGKILKTLIDSINSFSIIVLEDSELPETGENYTIYLKKREDSENDSYNEYLFINNKWELIGNTEIDLSNYYTKSEISNNYYNKSEIDKNHYNKSEIDDKISNFGNVKSNNNFTTIDRVIVSADTEKTIKESGILLSNLALKSYVDEKEIEWDKVINKPNSYPPESHTHTISQITDYVIDDSLDLESTNPVQNKIITEELNKIVNNSDLSNYYNKSEVDDKFNNINLSNYYNKTEIDNKFDQIDLSEYFTKTEITDNYYNKSQIDSKLSDSGNGDVIADSILTDNYLILGSDNKNIKISEYTIDKIATKNWVSSQNYITEIPKINWNDILNKPEFSEVAISGSYNDLIDKPKLSEVATSGSYNDLLDKPEIQELPVFTEEKNGLVPATGSLTTEKVLLSTGEWCVLKSLVFNINGTNKFIYAPQEDVDPDAINIWNYLRLDGPITVRTSSESAITLWLEFPETLPNPKALTINGKSYTGNTEVTINTPKILEFQNLDTTVEAGYIYYNTSTKSISTFNNFSLNNPDSIIYSTSKITFSGNCKLMKNIDLLSGSTYVYCLSWMPTGSSTGIVAINCAIYE